MKLIRRLTLAIAGAAISAFTSWGIAAPGDVDLSFGADPGLDGLVYRMAVQSDGKFIIAGQFTHVTGLSRTNLARLNADGSGDPTFQAVDIGSFGQIFSLAVQQDGKVLIGGNFTNVNGVSRNGIARLHANGGVDAPYNPGTGAVSKLLLQPDGKLLVGLSGDGGADHTVIRLNDDGNIDPSFNAGDSVAGSLLAVSPEGKVLLLGSVSFNSGTGIYRHTLVRLLGNGSVDPGFASALDVDGGVGAVAFQTGGKAVITGSFYSINGVPRGHVARLNDDGSFDSTFDPGHTVIRDSFDGESAVWSLAVRPNGKVIVGGPIKTKDFDADLIFRRGFLIGLESDGSEDLTFTRTMASAAVHSVVLQPDGRVLVGGLFSEVNGITRNRLARFLPDGTLDSTLNTESGPNGPVRAVALQPDGKVILGGDFTSVGGGTNKFIARMQPDGSLDTTFNAYLDGSDPKVFALAVQPDNKVLVGGTFSNPLNVFGGHDRDNLARLNADGSMDSTFNIITGPDDEVRAIVLQPDGKILIGGDFCVVNGTARCAIARLNPDGSVDPTFDPGTGANDVVLSIALQPDGKVLIAGDFGSVNGVTRQFIARLNADGSLDTAFGSTLRVVGGRIGSIVLQGNGKMLIGGAFTWINGFSRSGIARLHADGSLDESFHPAFETVAGFTSMSSLLVQPDGKAILSGAFTNVDGVPRQGLVRLNSDDSVDTSFNPGHGEVASCLALQPDGKLLLGGAFTSFNGVPRSYVVRLIGSLPLISVQPTNRLVNAGPY